MAQDNPGEHGRHKGARAAVESGAQIHEGHTNEIQSVPATATDGNGSTLASKAATVAVVGLGAALIEAELIPGILIGVAAMLAPNLLPKVGNGLRPIVKGIVKAGYTLTERARETFAEAGEQMQDIVAEVRAEQHTGMPSTAAPEPAAQP